MIARLTATSVRAERYAAALSEPTRDDDETGEGEEEPADDDDDEPPEDPDKTEPGGTPLAN